MTIASLDGGILARLLEACGDAIFVADHDGRYLAANQAAFDLLGYTLEELRARTMAEVSVPEDRTRLPERMEGLRQDRHRLVERDLLHRDGHRIPVEIGATALPDGRVVGIVRDISARRAAQERARRLQRHLETALSVAEEVSGVGRLDLQAFCERLVEAHHYALVWVGRALWEDGSVEVLASAGRAAAYARTITVRCDDTPEGNGPTGRCLKSGRRVLSGDLSADPIFEPWRQPASGYALRSSAAFPLVIGRRVWGAMNVYAQEQSFFDALEVTLLERVALLLGRALATHAMVGERSPIEQRVLAADRLAALGALATGVTQALRSSLEEVARGLEALDEGGALGEVGAALRERVSGTLSLLGRIPQEAHTAKGGREALPLREVVESALEVAEPYLKQHARLRLHVPANLLVFAQRGYLEQILLDLLVNAGKALQGGDPRENEIRVEAAIGGDEWVRLRVIDTGPGVPEEMREDVFEPLFSAWPAGEASGLGLTVSRALAEGMGGHLMLRETLGGACFELELPAPPKAGAASASREVTEVRGEGWRPRILIVESDPALRDALAGLLALPYEVRACSDPEEGLERCQAERFDVVLCDVHLPESACVTFFQKLRARGDPHLDRLAFMIGGRPGPKADAFLSTVVSPVLPKPVGLDAVEALLAR